MAMLMMVDDGGSWLVLDITPRYKERHIQKGRPRLLVTLNSLQMLVIRINLWLARGSTTANIQLEAKNRVVVFLFEEHAYHNPQLRIWQKTCKHNFAKTKWRSVFISNPNTGCGHDNGGSQSFTWMRCGK